MESGMDLSALPEGCIATILSLTSPEDACRLSLLCKTFLSAATSDAVWGSFLPADYTDIVSRSSSSPSGDSSVGSKRELYFRLCDHPLPIEGNTMNFSLERRSGKKCYMLSARKLRITWGDSPQYWDWESSPEFGFEVARLHVVWWFEICGKISTSILSPKTNYAAYFVFKWLEDSYGFRNCPLKLSIGPLGGEKKVQQINFDPWQYIDDIPQRNSGARLLGWSRSRRQGEKCSVGLKKRADGWNEIEIGEFFNSGDEDEDLEIDLLEVDGGDPKSGLMVYGIEIRPKEG